MYKLYVWKERGGWMVDMSKSEAADRIMDLFDTHRLPLPFTDQASTREVMRSLIHKNPGHLIIGPGGLSIQA
jgi:hypothetical protein